MLTGKNGLRAEFLHAQHNGAGPCTGDITMEDLCRRDVALYISTAHPAAVFPVVALLTCPAESGRNESGQGKTLHARCQAAGQM